MKKWVTVVASVGVLAAGCGLVYWQWDSIWAFVFSPIGGIAAKVLFTGKAVKIVVGVAFAVGAGVVAVRGKLRRAAPEPPAQLAPPVFGPPEEAAPSSAGTEAATTTGFSTVPDRRPT